MPTSARSRRTRCLVAKPSGDAEDAEDEEGDSSDEREKEGEGRRDEEEDGDGFLAERSPPLLRALARKEARGEEDDDGWGPAAEVEADAEEDSRRRCFVVFLFFLKV